MIDSYHEVLETLSGTPSKIQDLISAGDVPPPDGSDEWSAVEIIAHLADVEKLYRGRMQEMLTKRTPPYLRNFDQEAAAREGDYASRDLRASLEDFANERAETISLLMNLALKDWEKTGIHDQMGEVSVEDLAERLIDHDEEHLAQLEQALGR